MPIFTCIYTYVFVVFIYALDGLGGCFKADWLHQKCQKYKLACYILQSYYFTSQFLNFIS